MKTLAPCPQLRPYVKCYHIMDDAKSRSSVNFPASSCPYIKISSHSVLFTGQTTRPSLASIEDPGVGVGFSLRPGGAFGLTGVPMNHLTDRVHRLGDMVNCRLGEFLDEICSAKSAARQIAKLEAFLLGLIKANRQEERDKAGLIEAIASSSYGSLRSIARELGLSGRHLRRIINERVGFSPRLLQRILRFERVVEHLSSARTPIRWAETACGFGYADQAHLIREFREFSGRTPREYMSDPFNSK